MRKYINKNPFFKPVIVNRAKKKILFTLLVLFVYRLGNAIPLIGLDQEALKKSLFDPANRNTLTQIINMYSGGGGKTVVSSFSLGIIPFINAAILVDLLAAIFPSLEKLQSEEGEMGRQKIMFYKKVLTFLFATAQSIFLLSYLKPYFYVSDLYSFSIFVIELVSGSMIVVWLSNLIDNNGIGSGTSLMIFTNIVITLFSKNLFTSQIFNISFYVELIFLLFLIGLICILQLSRTTIKVVSARQLAFLQNLEKRDWQEQIETKFQLKDNGLSIKFNQAGIFPIIIASNLLPFIAYFTENFLRQGKMSILNTIFYYVCIVVFNFFYTVIFWDPEKISEQLRKASVSLVNVTPGRDTVVYLQKIVWSTSIAGGGLLCIILVLYDSIKPLTKGLLLNQINVSSLIILIGVAFETQRTIRSLVQD